MHPPDWQIHHPEGKYRVIVTRTLPGRRWLDLLIEADCRVEVFCNADTAINAGTILSAMEIRCNGVIGQLTETWDETLFFALKKAGGAVFSNYAVGYDNVDLDAATRAGIPVGNTPDALTEATAEMAVALTFAAARRIGEAERYLRAGRFNGWRPDLLLGVQLSGKILGIIGAGRIGGAYARMMVQGHGMNLIYHGRNTNAALESFVANFNRFRIRQSLMPVTCRRTESLDELLETADCVSIHTVLDDTTHHLIDARRLCLMKNDAVLINTSRGPVVDESALVDHCRRNRNFRAGLDVFENEPALTPGLAKLENVVIVPHIGSATRWAREGMATLAALNIVGILAGYPLWNRKDIVPFLSKNPPKAVPSIVNPQVIP